MRVVSVCVGMSVCGDVCVWGVSVCRHVWCTQLHRFPHGPREIDKQPRLADTAGTTGERTSSTSHSGKKVMFEPLFCFVLLWRFPRLLPPLLLYPSIIYLRVHIHVWSGTLLSCIITNNGRLVMRKDSW